MSQVALTIWLTLGKEPPYWARFLACRALCACNWNSEEIHQIKNKKKHVPNADLCTGASNKVNYCQKSAWMEKETCFTIEYNCSGASLNNSNTIVVNPKITIDLPPPIYGPRRIVFCSPALHARTHTESVLTKVSRLCNSIKKHALLLIHGLFYIVSL